MGLKLRYNLFWNTTASAVFECYASVFAERRRPFGVSGNDAERFDFYTEDNGWTVVSLDSGWEWEDRRETQFCVSRRLWCPGFLIFVYDGNYWGYEFFDRGQSIDHFVQEATGQPVGFPGEDCRGKPELIAAHLPMLRAEEIAPYLVQKHDWVIPEGANILARSGDEFRRFDECAVLDFLRMLGVRIQLEDDYVKLQSPLFKSAFSTWSRKTGAV
jgi:hypothetical protein